MHALNTTFVVLLLSAGGAWAAVPSNVSQSGSEAQSVLLLPGRVVEVAAELVVVIAK